MKNSLLIICIICFSACGGLLPPAQEDHHVHSHEEETKLDTTIWTKSHEYFIEYEPLIVGQISHFAIHITENIHHQPIKTGSLTLSLIQGKKGIRQKKDKPTKAGIFTPTLRPLAAGPCQLSIELQTADSTHSVLISDLMVYPNPKKALITVEQNPKKDGIHFSKEKAWQLTNFQTVSAQKKSIYETADTHGEWLPTPGEHFYVVATSNGMIYFPPNDLMAGQKVQKGQLLFTIQSEGLTKENYATLYEKLKIEYEQKKALYERKKPLYEKRIIPKSEFEIAEKEYQIALTEWKSRSANYSKEGKKIYAPTSGYIKQVIAEHGAYVEQGNPLLVMGPENSTLLRAELSPSYFEKIPIIQEIWIKDRQTEWVNVRDLNGAVKSIGHSVEKSHPLIPVYIEFKRGLNVLEGSIAEVQFGFGHPNPSITVPQTALLESFGSYSVIVALNGEMYENRNVKIGKQNGKWVEILSGLAEGERVVSQGAYQVKMAQMSDQLPAHGHVH